MDYSGKEINLFLNGPSYLEFMNIEKLERIFT